MAKDYFQTNEFKELLKYYERHKEADKKSIYLDDEEFADLADYYLSNEIPDMAMEAVNMGLDIHRDSDILLTMKSAIHIYLFQFKEAEAILAKLDENDPEVLYQLAQLQYAYYFNIPNAEKMWKKWLKIDNEIDDTDEEYRKENYIHILSTLVVLRDSQDVSDDEKGEIINALRRWVREYIDTFQPLGKSDYDIQVVDICRENDLADLLCEALAQILEERPYLPKGWSTLALAHYVRKEPEQALEACAFALAINPDDLDALLTKAYTLYDINDKQGAKPILKEYIDKGGEPVQILPYAEMLFNDGEKDKAFAQLQSLLKYLEKTKKILEERKGKAADTSMKEFQNKEYEIFMDQYKKVLSDMGYLYYRNKYNKESLLSFVRLIEVGEETTEAFLMVAINCLDLHYFKEARNAFWQAISIAEDKVMVGINIALTLIQNNYDNHALEVFEHVDSIAETSDSPFVQNIAAAKSVLYIKTGDMKRFFKFFKTACEETPDLVKRVYGNVFPVNMPVNEWYDYALHETQTLQKKFNEEGVRLGGF